MMFLTRRRIAPVLAVAVPVFAALISGCGGSGLTATPLSASLSHTFANLYVLQQADEGNPKPSVGSLHSRASCQKGTPATPQNGSGNWLCEISFDVPGAAGYPVIAKYSVDVQTDGCYAADGDGPTTLNGSPTVTGPHFVQLINPLFLIDGCFDAD